MSHNERHNVLVANVSAGQAPPIVITAGLAAAILLAAIGWQLGGEFRAERTSADSLEFERPAGEKVPERPSFSGRNWQEELVRLGLISTSTDPGADVATTSLPSVGDMIAEQMISGYLSLKESGRFTPERGQLLGQYIGANVRTPSSFVMRGNSELKTSTDISETAALLYRADMRDALAVLITNDPPEFETFAYYIETRNPQRLGELSTAAKRYQQAEKNALAVTVPQDAALIHLRVVNALGSYADALGQLIRYADDSLATLAVLRTYNEAEREMLYAFDALASYYVRKSSAD